MDYFDITVRFVPAYGWLPIIVKDGKELFRGSFYKTQALAYDIACIYAEQYLRD